MQETKFLTEGDYTLSSLQLISGDTVINLDATYSMIEFDESIFKTCMSGIIRVTDAMGVFGTMPIMGGEILKMGFVDALDVKFDHTFIIYKMSNRSRGDSQTYSYTLHFISPEAITSSRRKISKAFSGKTGTDISKELFKELDSDREIDVEIGKNRHGIIIPRLTPLDAISWVSSFSTSVDHPNSPMFFYESSEGFHIHSLDYMMNQEPPLRNRFSQYYTASNQPADKVLFNMTDYSVRQQFDTLAATMNGQFGSTLFAFDVINHQYKKSTFNYERDFEKTSKLDLVNFERNNLMKEPFDGSEAVFKSISTKNFHVLDSYATEHGVDQETASLKHRESNILTKVAQTSDLAYIEFTMNISPSFSFGAGKTVYIDVPNSNHGDSDSHDPIISGKYLIISVKHSLNNKNYVMNVIAIRNTINRESL